jgi:hypothetical protein
VRKKSGGPKSYLVIFSVQSERSAKEVQSAMLAALAKRYPDGTDVNHVAVIRDGRVVAKVRL